ncbi:GNAT family N-acetyltransferase [Euhalothece natronophila Z-M001]|uniref:GNAT family N-acetyltransferase n=1 Tax=Euhalothece natronophila Z-M001 TaxID=522448 RepID=A0A5B8NMJ1_9CHRO|nr:N-acetyltransferase [Euhalothece natronophila]QDZ39329.1 GNAT family N-acetyltransferase [Euhalothece natronophila Z-M001]
MDQPTIVSGMVFPSPLAEPCQLQIIELNEISVAATLLVSAFGSEPAAVALFPNPRHRYHYQMITAKILLSSIIPHGSVYGVTCHGELAGIAVWLPPSVNSGFKWRMTRYLLELVLVSLQFPTALPKALWTQWRDRAVVRKVLRIKREIDTMTNGQPYWYLKALATKAEFRGRGIAHHLLKQILTHCDQKQLEVWLDTTEAVNVSFYQRLGFETVYETEAGKFLPSFWLMRRNPQPIA